MCGIIATISKRGKKVGKAVLQKYEIQKSRGHEGFGYCALDNGSVRVERAEKEEKIRSLLKHDSSPFVIFHHRFPTSTINVEECTHPIFVSHEELDYNYYVVHNGVLRNEDELKKKHEAYPTPYKYNTELIYSSKSSYKSKSTGQEYRTEVKDTPEFNDSESFAIELARYLDGMSHKIDCVGSIAFVCMQTTKEGKFVKLHFGHNSNNPLCIEEDNENIYIKSVGGKALEEDKIYTYTYKDDGTVEESTVVCDVGYTSEYNRTQGTNYPALKEHTYSKYTPKQVNRMGYNTDDFDDIPVIDVSEYSGASAFLNKKTNEAVAEYSDLQFDLEMSEEDINTATNLLLENSDDENSCILLNNEIAELKENIKVILEKMNKIEEDYYLYNRSGNVDFLDLVEKFQDEESMGSNVEYRQGVLLDGYPA